MRLTLYCRTFGGTRCVVIPLLFVLRREVQERLRVASTFTTLCTSLIGAGVLYNRGTLEMRCILAVISVGCLPGQPELSETIADSVTKRRIRVSGVVHLRWRYSLGLSCQKSE